MRMQLKAACRMNTQLTYRSAVANHRRAGERSICASQPEIELKCSLERYATCQTFADTAFCTETCVRFTFAHVFIRYFLTLGFALLAHTNRIVPSPSRVTTCPNSPSFVSLLPLQARRVCPVHSRTQSEPREYQVAQQRRPAARGRVTTAPG